MSIMRQPLAMLELTLPTSVPSLGRVSQVRVASVQFQPTR